MNLDSWTRLDMNGNKYADELAKNAIKSANIIKPDLIT